MQESSLLVGHIGSEIFTAYHVPAPAKFVLHLLFYYSCHFAVFLSLKNPLDVGNFLDGRVRYTDYDALLFGRHIRVSNKYLFRWLLLIVVILLRLQVMGIDRSRHRIYITSKDYNLYF